MDASQRDLSQGLEELTAASALRRAEATAVADAAADRRRPFDLVPIAYVVTDRNGLIADANDVAAALLGLAEERLVGKPLATYVAQTDRRAFRRLLLRLGAGSGAHGCELVLQGRSGIPFDAELIAVPDGSSLRFTVRDIRERNAAAVELRALTEELERRVAERAAEAEHQRALLEHVLDQIPLALLVAEAPSGRVVIMNAAARRLNNAEPAAPASVDDYPSGWRLDGREVLPRDWPLARAVLRGEQVEAEIIELAYPDGPRTLFEVSASPIRGADGAVVAGVAVIEDVTERERLESAERDFIANAAHELQTPVAAITSAVEALLAGAQDDHDERERFLSHLHRETIRLGRLSTALLVLARAERSGTPPRLELLPLEPLLREAAETIPPADGVEVRVDCGADVGILTHRDLFVQVLISLGRNAARHTPSGRITFGARLTGKMRVTVEVSDTGTGIPYEHQQHVFRRFYRTDSAGAGTGLGLAIALQAAQALGGRLELASTPGEGTTLTLTLPGARLIS